MLYVNEANEHLPYISKAFRDGTLTDIRDVERGLACRCVCVACHSTLIAKKGDELVHHFAHASGVECGHAQETLTHLLAKEFLTVTKTLTLPPVYAIPDDEILSKHRDVCFSEISLERRLGNIVPDIVATTSSGRQLLIEIAVTHESDQDKIRKIATFGISAVEIHVPNGQELDFETFRNIFESRTAEKYWLFNVKAAERRLSLPGWENFDHTTATYVREPFGYYPENLEEFEFSPPPENSLPAFNQPDWEDLRAFARYTREALDANPNLKSSGHWKAFWVNNLRSARAKGYPGDPRSWFAFLRMCGRLK